MSCYYCHGKLPENPIIDHNGNKYCKRHCFIIVVNQRKRHKSVAKILALPVNEREKPCKVCGIIIKAINCRCYTVYLKQQTCSKRCGHMLAIKNITCGLEPDPDEIRQAAEKIKNENLETYRRCL